MNNIALNRCPSLWSVTTADLTVSIVWVFQIAHLTLSILSTDKVRSPSPIWSYQFLRSFRSPIWFYQFFAYLQLDRWSDCITIQKVVDCRISSVMYLSVVSRYNICYYVVYTVPVSWTINIRLSVPAAYNCKS